MDFLEHAATLPAGSPVPNTPHAVCVHFPTMADVIGYEEKEPSLMARIRGGYPRFVRHPYLRKLAAHLAKTHGLGDRTVCLLKSPRSAREIAEYTIPDDFDFFQDGNITVFHCEPDDDLRQRAANFLQHTGCGLSSRQAEDVLVRAGLLESVTQEAVVIEEAPERVREELARAFGLRRHDAVLLCNSGMNAFYAAFKSAQELMLTEGRDLWIQLGWLYLDTAKVMEEFLEPGVKARVFQVVDDLDELEVFLKAFGQRVAGIVTEVPTNPLLHTVDLVRLREMADSCGALLFLDPTLASACNLDILPFADVVLTSLTKYAASDADVMAGAVLVNPDRPHAAELLAGAVTCHEPPYFRDISRLAHEIRNMEQVVKRVNHNTVQVASFLEAHPRVRAVHWAYSKRTRSNYERLSRGGMRPGSVISFEVDLPLAEFYDRCPIVKGPSFGARFSLLCPYLFLAHYDLVSSSSGRNRLRSAGINPELVRLSVGLEEPERIIAVLRTGLGDGPP